MEMKLKTEEQVNTQLRLADDSYNTELWLADGYNTEIWLADGYNT